MSECGVVSAARGTRVLVAFIGLGAVACVAERRDGRCWNGSGEEQERAGQCSREKKYLWRKHCKVATRSLGHACTSAHNNEKRGGRGSVIIGNSGGGGGGGGGVWRMAGKDTRTQKQESVVDSVQSTK